MSKTEFFKEAFKGYKVPQQIKTISETICNQFNIKGICDPMYISNVIAFELGVGDGCGKFNNNNLDITKLDKISQRLKISYGCNINDSELVKNIIATNI